MGLRLACSHVNVAPHLWAWLAATACSPEKMMRRELRCRWDGHCSQTLPGPAFHCYYYLCSRRFYLWLVWYYIKFSLSSTVIYIPITSEYINNWLPPSTGQCCIICWHSSAPEGCYSPVVCGLGFTSVLQGRCWDQTTPPQQQSMPLQL